MSWWGPWYGATEVPTPVEEPEPAEGLEIAHMAAVNGVLWGQTPEGNIVSYDQSIEDNTELYSMRIVTGTLRPGPVPLAWGRVRSVNVNSKILGAHTLRARVYADERDKEILDDSLAVVASDPTTWPYGLSPEFRTTSQRCAFIKAELIATPAAAEWTSIDIWAAPSDERAPSRNRS
jgi:hypothetical protein